MSLNTVYLLSPGDDPYSQHTIKDADLLDVHLQHKEEDDDINESRPTQELVVKLFKMLGKSHWELKALINHKNVQIDQLKGQIINNAQEIQKLWELIVLKILNLYTTIVATNLSLLYMTVLSLTL